MNNTTYWDVPNSHKLYTENKFLENYDSSVSTLCPGQPHPAWILKYFLFPSLKKLYQSTTVCSNLQLTHGIGLEQIL
jgi:hypothetical protein